MSDASGKLYRAEKITILMKALARPVTARELTNILFPGNIYQANVNSELNEMIRKGTVVRSGVGTSESPYYYEQVNDKKRNYFYVMQNRTFDAEYGGGYLWAPQKGNNGSVAHHSWSRMKEVKEGDVILHGYRQRVAAVSIARSDCYSALRPDELADLWTSEGWRVESEYLILDAPISPRDIWNELQPLLPGMYAPFARDGSGNQGYLFAANVDMCRCILDNTSSHGAPGKGVSPEPTTIPVVPKESSEDDEMADLLDEKPTVVLTNYIKQFNKNFSKYKERENELEVLRAKFVDDYKMQVLINMKIEDYVIGLNEKNGFCYRLENELMDLGDIHGATSLKFGIYYGKSGSDSEKKYRYAQRFGDDVETAFEKVKEEIVLLCVAGEKGDFEAIRNSMLAPIFRGKILSTFFPEVYLCIFSDEHLDYFLLKAGITSSDSGDILSKQQSLVDWKNVNPVMKNWTMYMFAKFLYETLGHPLTKVSTGDNEQDERDKEYPREYVSQVGITIGQWKEMLKDNSIFTEKDIALLKRFYLSDNHASTCYDMGALDGVSPTSYIKPVVALARRIAEKMDLPPIYGDAEKQTWWRIPFWGAYREDGHFEWKLRPKLAKAMLQVFPELGDLENREEDEKEDAGLIDELKQASFANAAEGFEYSGGEKPRQAPKITNGHKTYPRDRQVAINALAHAHYECEIAAGHPLFKRRQSDVNYTEPHHLVPMAFSGEFKVTLDREENIVSLCSNCHNQIHYGKGADELLMRLYAARKEYLESVGIYITQEKLLEMYKL